MQTLTPLPVRKMHLVSIELDCGHRHLTLMQVVLDNRIGLWWCTPCGTGNHVERIYHG